MRGGSQRVASSARGTRSQSRCTKLRVQAHLLLSGHSSGGTREYPLLTLTKCTHSVAEPPPSSPAPTPPATLSLISTLTQRYYSLQAEPLFHKAAKEHYTPQKTCHLLKGRLATFGFQHRLPRGYLARSLQTTYQQWSREFPSRFQPRTDLR